MASAAAARSSARFGAGPAAVSPPAAVAEAAQVASADFGSLAVHAPSLRTPTASSRLAAFPRELLKGSGLPKIRRRGEIQSVKQLLIHAREGRRQQLVIHARGERREAGYFNCLRLKENCKIRACDLLPLPHFCIIFFRWRPSLRGAVLPTPRA